MKFILFFLVLLSFVLSSCGSYSSKYDKIKQGVVFYPTSDFWKKDTSANHYFNQPLDSVKELLNYDTTRLNRFLVRIEGVGCVLPDVIHPNSFYRDGQIVDVKYQESDLSPAKAPFWTCRFNTHDKLFQETVYKAEVDIITRKYQNPVTFILGWIQICVSLCVIALILYVWITFHRRQKGTNLKPLGERLRQDAGIAFLAAALFFWAVIGLIRIESDNAAISDIMTRVFSMVNNALFLLALPYFRHGVSHFKKYSQTYLLIGSCLVLVSLLTMISTAISPNQYKNIFKLFDVIYSTAVLVLLGWLFIASFHKRNLDGIAVLSGIITIGAVYTQIIPHFPDFNFASGLFRPICYFTTFVMFTTLLVALTFSWYNEEMVKEAIDKTTEKFARMQELILDKSKSKEEKYSALEQSLSDDDMELAFTGFACVQASNSNVIIQSSRYMTAKKSYQMGQISHADFLLTKNQVVAALLALLKELFPE